jgi:integrase
LVYRRKYKAKNTGRSLECRTYNYDFIFRGRRYRGSTDCTTKTRAKAFEKDFRERLERALSGLPTEKPDGRVRTVSAALNEYEEHYAIDHAPGSLAWVKERGAHLRRLLGSEIAAALTEKRVQAYRHKRLGESAGQRTVDMEVEILSRAFGVKWSTWWPRLKRLDKGSKAGQVIPSEEEPRILDAAAKSGSPYLYTYLVIAFSTGMRAGENGLLRWDRFTIGDSHRESYVRVGKSKTPAGEDRVIPMEERLWTAITRYRSWYVENLGKIRPEWYVFPLSKHHKPIDPLQSGVAAIKSAWYALKAQLKIDYRLHDTRHTVATAMAVAKVPDATRRYVMGHVDEKVIERYTHLAAEDCREDLERALKLRRSSFRVPAVSPTVKPKRRLAVAGK